MNIIVVNDYASINGGADAVAIESALALAQAGESVIFFCAVGPADERLIQKNISVICMDQKDILSDGAGSAAMFGIWNRRAYLSMMRLLGSVDKKDAIVHFHSFTKALSSSVIRAAADSGFKRVLTMHDYFVACPNGGFYDYNKAEICGLRAMSPSCIGTNCDKRKYAHKLWRCTRQAAQIRKGRVPSGVDALISVSDYSERLLRPYLPETAAVYRVRNPISVRNEGPEKVSERGLFSFAGRLSMEKGPHLFARAASVTGVEAAFIGDGPMRGQLEEIMPGAVFSGWLRQENVVRLMRESRALVFPSLWHETLGLTVLQAKALGIPAIVSSGCAASELVEHGEDGLIFEKGSVEDLAEKIKIMCNNSAARRMGKTAHRRYWDEPWTLENHAQELMRVYRDIQGDGE